MMGKKKEEVITFKADAALSRLLARVPNRSAFIRNAILLASEHICPLCQGTGVLSPDQREHWDDFSRNHKLEECTTCHAIYLTCKSG